MKQIFKNLAPHWKAVVLILLMLSVQAFCDLALPSYTADIIDVGITNSGIPDAVPESLKEDSFNEVLAFVSNSEETETNIVPSKVDKKILDRIVSLIDNDADRETVYSAYTLGDGDVYTLNSTSSKSNLNKILSKPVALYYIIDYAINNPDELKKMAESSGEDTSSMSSMLDGDSNDIWKSISKLSPKMVGKIENEVIEKSGMNVEDSMYSTIAYVWYQQNNKNFDITEYNNKNESWIRECYTLKDDGTYYLNDGLTKDQRENLSNVFKTPICMNYMLSMMETDPDAANELMGSTSADEKSNDDFDMTSLSNIDESTKKTIYNMLGLSEDASITDVLALMPNAEKVEIITKITDKMGTAFDTMADSCDAKWITNEYNAQGIDTKAIQKSYLWQAGIKMILVTLILVIAAIIAGFFASKTAAKVGKNLRSSVYKKVVSFSNTEMDKFSTSSLITRSTNDVQQIQFTTVMLLRMVLYAPVVGIGAVIKVVGTKSGMGWLIAVAVAVLIAFVGSLVAAAMPKFKIMQTLVDKVNLVSREILTGLSVIRAFGREEEEEKRFDKANENLKRTQLFTNRVMTLMMPGMMFLMYVFTISIVWVASKKIDAGTLQVGAMTAFITYAMQIVMAFLMLTAMSIMLPRAGVAADRVQEVIDTKISITDKKDAKELECTEGSVEFRDVAFRYPNAEEDVLADISFTANAGETTAIIGSTGCGKSTVVNLIPRFYDVTAGEILIDNQPIRDVSIKSLRDKIGFVPQKGVLFSGTIASNIAFGDSNMPSETIEKAAKIAQATEFIDDKSEKYESTISQGGSNVSGGQKQRLAIARAIAKNPEILIFDDSFSALDMKTDAVLRKALEEETEKRTVIIVAQRISTIINANKIVVLDDGKIVGIGTHAELLENCEVYRQIAISQLSAKELGIEEGKEEL